mgnify:CR=1 FL=1
MKTKTLILVCLVIILFMLSPLIFVLGYGFILNQQGQTVDDSIYEHGFLIFYTFPIGLCILLILFVVTYIEKLKPKK